MSRNLNPQKALIFRIVHIDNVPWILRNGGLYARSSPWQDRNYVSIGSAELIGKRMQRQVPLPPGGTLGDYVPFYFTPFSMMMYNIKTGYNGVTKRPNRDIVIFVSSIHRLAEAGLPFVFTNGHAYMIEADFYNQVADLDKIDWPLLQKRDFQRDQNDFYKQFRYQAEALAHQHVPLKALIAVCCHDDGIRERLSLKLGEMGANLPVNVTPRFYF